METGASNVSSGWKWVPHVVAAAAIVVAAKFLHFQDLLKAALDWIGKLGAWGPVIFIGIYIACSFVHFTKANTCFMKKP